MNHRVLNRWWGAVPLLMVLSGCAEDIDLYTPPSGSVQALFDPSSSPPQVPTPTDLIRNPLTRRLMLPNAGCTFTRSGPYEKATVADTLDKAKAATALKVASKAYRLAVSSTVAGYVRLDVEQGGDYVVTFDQDVTLDVQDDKGVSQTITRSDKSVSTCQEVKGQHLFSLAAMGTYILKIGAKDKVTTLTMVLAKDTAQAAFDRYLNTLDGYPETATAEFWFAGEVDTTTITSKTVLGFNITTATAPTPLNIITDVKNAKGSGDVLLESAVVAQTDGSKRTRVRLWALQGWARQASYAFYVLGGTSGVLAAKASDGSQGQVIRSALFELATGDRPLCAWDAKRSWDSSTGTCAVPASGSTATGCCTFNYAALIDSTVKKSMRARTDLADLSEHDLEQLMAREILAKATDFERMRQGFSSLLKLLESASSSLKKDDVVLLFSFTTAGLNEAVFSPVGSSPKIPLPNDLVRDPSTGLLNIPDASGISEAEKEFNTYLRTLDGWLPTTPGSIEFRADLDSTTVDGKSILVYEVDSTGLKADATATIAYDATTDKVSITKKGGFKRATQYAVFTISGTNGVKNKDTTLAGEPRRSPLMALALSPLALCTWDKTRSLDSTGSCSSPASGATATGCCTDTLISSFIDDPTGVTGGMTSLQKATRFEMLRQGYDKLVKLLVAGGTVKRDDIASLFSFTTVSQSELTYDPTTGVIPYPNNLLLDPSTGKVNIPAGASETAAQKALRLGLNTLDGFTTQGQYYAAFQGKLDKNSLKLGTSLLVLNLSTGKAVTTVSGTVDETAGAVVVSPTEPFDEKTTYAIVVTSKATSGSQLAAGGLTDEKGRRVVPSPFMALIKAKNELYKNNKSTVSTLDDTTAKSAETARLAHVALFKALDGMSIARGDIVAAWTFTTQTITEPLTKLRALPYSILGKIDLANPKFSGTLVPASTIPGGGSTIPIDKIAYWVPQGKFDSVLALDETQGVLGSDPTKYTAGKLPFMATIPTGTAPTSGWPVVLVQHGLGRSKSDFLAVANTLATAGLAAVAFDVIYHGERSWCTKDSHCASSGATCDTKTGKCSTGSLKTDSSGLPDASGARFLNTDNPFAVRDNMRQHVVDAGAMLRALALDAEAGLTDSSSTTGVVAFDQTKVYYVGQSLGAILGTLVLATDAVPKRGLLNVPGAPVVDVILTAPSFKSIKDALLKAQGITEGSLAYQQLKTTFTWILDPADPGNFAQYLETKQLVDQTSTSGAKVPAKEVMVQLAGKDQTIPTKLGQYLAGLAGISTSEMQKTTFTDQGHSFLFSPDPSTSLAATKAAQTQMATFLLTGQVCTPNTSSGTCN